MGDSGHYGDDHGGGGGRKLTPPVAPSGFGGSGGGGKKAPLPQAPHGSGGGGSDRLEMKEARHTGVLPRMRGGDAQEVNEGRDVAPPLNAGPMRGALQCAMSEEDRDGTHRGAARGGVARLEQRLEEEIRQRVAGEVRDSQCCASYEIAVLAVWRGGGSGGGEGGGGGDAGSVGWMHMHAHVCVVASAHGCTCYDVYSL